MNHLAHVFLSGNNEPLLVGNFLGDFISNREVAVLPAEVQAGVRLHRQIDHFTDGHPAVRASVEKLRGAHGRYAPVVLDVLHDYILTQNWERYADQSLPVFAANAYRVLQSHVHLMPGFLQERLPLMVEDDWLVRYGTLDGLRFTFSRLKKRSSKPDLFDAAVDSLQSKYEELEVDFRLFFPDLLRAVGSGVW